MVKSLLLAIAVLITSIFEVTPSYAQGCGYYTTYGQVLCRDYKGRSVSTSHCNRYTSEIGPRPPVPSRSCPNPCCTETHTVDGAVVSSSVKVAGSCNSTSRTTTCDERGDCATQPSAPPPSGGGAGEPACSNTTRTETQTFSESCPVNHKGNISVTQSRTITVASDCMETASAWVETGRSTNCMARPKCWTTGGSGCWAGFYTLQTIYREFDPEEESCESVFDGNGPNPCL